MKAFIIILAFLYCCSPEREIQVHSESWTLVEKRPTSRYFDGDFTWLIWENQDGLRYSERVPDNVALCYPVGAIVLTRIK